jgi:fused signal recognition particle receptor
MDFNTNTLMMIAAAVVFLILVAVILVVLKKKEKPVSKVVKQSGEQPESLRIKLAKTKSGFTAKLAEIIRIRGKVDEELLEQLEETLLQADIGVEASMDIIEKLREEIQINKLTDKDVVQKQLEDIIKNMLLKDYNDEKGFKIIAEKKPFIVLFVGVNGVGKTTSIGKLAGRFYDEGNKVLLIAADTFRAAAAEQLSIWAERTNSEIIKQQQGSDPSSVVYDGVMKAVNGKFDVVLIDTAGRQHTKVNLMNELSKIERTIKKIVPQGADETLLVIDATTGQNAISQAELFNKAANLSGIVLTKLDGTAKGGIVIGIKHHLHVPVKFIGVGESQQDLRDFDPREFTEAVFE